MRNEGIFERFWLPGAMQIPRSAMRTRRITGAPPGLGSILPQGPSPCDPENYYCQPADPGEEPWCAPSCPPGWLAVVDQGGAKYACLETASSDPGTPPVDPAKTCTDAGGVYSPADSTCKAPATPTTTPTPVTPAPPGGSTTPVPITPPAATAQPAAPPPSTPMPTWVYVGGGAAALLILGALVWK